MRYLCEKILRGSYSEKKYKKYGGEIMFCPNCGYENNDENQFCMKCGKSLTEEENILKSEISDHSETDIKSDEKSSERSLWYQNKPYLVSIISSIGGALICIFGCLLPFLNADIVIFKFSVSFIEGDGIIICILMAISIILSLIKLQKINIIPVILSADILYHDGKSVLEDEMTHFGTGFYCIIIGLIILLAGSLISFKGKWDKTGRLISKQIAWIKKHKICVIVICCILVTGIVMCILTFRYKIFCQHEWQSATCNSPEICSKCGKTQGEKLEHNWIPADCENPEKCSLCKETRGSALGHKWLEATCDKPKTCEVCNKTDGIANGHDWEAATCESPKKCNICKKTEGNAKGHKWQKATCTEPKICQNCGKTDGKPAGHKWKNATLYTPKTCSVCGETEGTALNYEYMSTGKVNVESGGLNLRKEMDKNSDVVTLIPKNTSIYLYNCHNSEWYYTEYDGKYGYVYAEYVSIDVPSYNQPSDESDNYDNRSFNETFEDEFNNLVEDMYWGVLSGQYDK